MQNKELNLGNLTMAFNPDTKRLAAALFTEDDIGAMLRCHFEVERAAIHALSNIDVAPPQSRSLQYLSQKLNRLETLGVPKHFLTPARVLNTHRNKFAHRGQELLTDEQAAELRVAVSSVIPKFQDGSRFTVHGSRTFDKTYSEASTKERYVMSSAYALTIIAAFPEIAAVAAAQKS